MFQGRFYMNEILIINVRMFTRFMFIFTFYLHFVSIEWDFRVW